MSGSSPTLPASVTDLRINLLGLVTMLGMAGWLLLGTGRSIAQIHAAVLLMVAVAAPIVLLDLVVRRVHRTTAAGLAWDRPPRPDGRRMATKLLGLAAVLACVLAVYGLTPEYQGEFYERYYAFLWAYGPPALVVGVAYMVWIDPRMEQPRDGYWHLGRALLGRTGDVDGFKVADLFRSWVIKGFFIPLMFTYTCNNVGDLRRLLGGGLPSTWIAGFDTLYSLTFLVDVSFTTVGYLLTLRLLDTHIRSAQPRMDGWVVALVCYEPFFSLINRQYIYYEDGFYWGKWLADTPMLKGLWGAGILLLVMGFSLSTITFGVRFSNLTHRGVITGGLYRLTKHPAYITKCVSFWMIFVPFVYRGSPYEVLRDCTWLSALCVIYWLRARTEERHLSEDPAYVRYGLWMNEHGLLAPLGRWLPFLRYRPPEDAASPRD